MTVVRATEGKEADQVGIVPQSSVMVDARKHVHTTRVLVCNATYVALCKCMIHTQE